MSRVSNLVRATARAENDDDEDEDKVVSGSPNTGVYSLSYLSL